MGHHLALVESYLTTIAEAAEQAAIPIETKRGLAAAANEIIRNSGKLYRLHHDFETYCDVSVVDVGADFYSRHESCEVLMCAYGVNNNEIQQWVPAEGEEMPAELDEMLADPNAIKFAWNKPFEWSIWENVLSRHIPHDQWRDPMVLCYSLSLPGKLEKAGEVVDIPEDSRKMKRGKLLIRKFCSPRKPTKANPNTRLFWYDEPADWEEFKLYNRTDVEAERAIYARTKKFDMPSWEWDLWVIDQEINQAGIPFNMNMVNNAITIYEDLVGDALEEMRLLTGLDNPNSGAQLLPWLVERGYPFEDLKKGHVERGRLRCVEQLAEADIGPDEQESILDLFLDAARDGRHYAPNREEAGLVIIERVLSLRLKAAKASPKKYYSLNECVDQSGPIPVLRNAFQFAGAGRTWRWSGRMFQAQNLPRPATKFLEKNIHMAARHVEELSAPALAAMWDDPFDVLTSCIRPTAQAPEGYVFVDADLNAIENRTLGWIAKCDKILRVFELNRDPYIDFGTYLFGGTYEQLWEEYKVGGNSTKRTISKPGVLGCGYMLSAGEIRVNRQTGEEEATGLLGYAWDMGIREFTQEQAKLSVDTFRREYSEVKDFWYAIERAAKKCVRTGRPTEINMIRFEMRHPFLCMVLPSGRALHYCRPRLEDVRAPWGEMKETLTYEGLNDKKQWLRQPTHPGKLTENADQAISRDLLAHGMRIAKREYNIDIRIHVHDQLVGLAPEDKAEETLKNLQEAMGRQPKWAAGLPLGSAGFISKIFIKD